MRLFCVIFPFFFFFFFFFNSTVECPILWEPMDNKCVLFIPDYKTILKNAPTICESLGGFALVIDSEEQNQNATNVLNLNSTSSNYMVLGCSNLNNFETWLCDGRSPYLVHWQNETEAGYWSEYIITCLF